MISLTDARNALKAFTAARHDRVVSPEVLASRANLCESCPQRRLVRVKARDQASKVLGLMANSHRVPGSLKDSKCGVCGCSLMLLLPALPGDLHKDNPVQAAERATKAPNCWLPAAQ